jgi:hypothetical protein
MLIFRPPKRFMFTKVAKTPMERLIDRLAPKMQRAVRQAVKRAQGRINLDELARAIEQGHLSRVELHLDIDRFTHTDLSEALKTISEAFVAGTRLGEVQIKGAYRFDVMNPKALAAAEHQAAELLTAVNEETRATVRGMIARAYREGLTAPQTARQIREVIGLNERQATALINYRFGLLEDGASPERVATLAERYGDRLLRQRADMIAQTEIHRASNEGQRELWREAVRNGRLNAARARVIWITNVGACSYCEGIADLNADGVSIDGEFLTGEGDAISGPEESHPNCGCNTGLIFGDEGD